MRTPKVFQRRNLPHLQPQEGTFFITYMLHGAIPSPLKNKLRAENELRLATHTERIDKDKENKRYFKAFDEVLDEINNNTC